MASLALLNEKMIDTQETRRENCRGTFLAVHTLQRVTRRQSNVLKM